MYLEMFDNGYLVNRDAKNDALKIILLIEPKSLAHQDPPFINRFQKHIIAFDNLCKFWYNINR